MNPADFGFDPKLATQAGIAIPIFVGALKAAKAMAVVPERFEMLLAAGITAGVQVLGGVAAGVPLLPSCSAAASGALLAMVGHAVLFKGKDQNETKP